MSTNFFTKQASWDKIALDPGSAALGLALAGSASGGGGGGGIPVGGLLTGAAVAGPVTGDVLQTYGYRLNKNWNSGVKGLANRLRYDEAIGKKVVDAFGDLASKAVTGVVDEGLSKYKKLRDLPSQKKVLEQLLKEDEVISRADSDQVANLYSSLQDIAPTVAKHREAVRSFLRQGLAHEGGVDPTTFGQLARTEQALKGKNLQQI
jgi:hypothetical protein